jgi:hypothetical protein
MKRAAGFYEIVQKPLILLRTSDIINIGDGEQNDNR